MVGTFTEGDVRHLDTHRKKSFTRQQTLISQSLISGRPISHHDMRIEISTAGGESTFLLSLEDALDLSLCMQLDPMNFEKTERFNPFKMHFEQRLAQGKLGFYV